MNITLNIDEEILKKVRKIAIDRDTTLTALVRDYLTWLAQGDAPDRQRHIALLDDSFQRISRDMGPRNWSRDDIHPQRQNRLK